STLKLLTTPEAPERAVAEGVTRILAATGIAPGAIGLFLHGTTLATNAVIERRGARTALVATAGFEDTIEIGREHRYDQYNLYLERPAPLVPPPLRFGLAERVDVDGSVATPLAEAEIERIVAQVGAAGAQSVAVCLLHSYANPAHERRLGKALAARLPGVSVSLSCDISPVIGEFERSSTTCANAYVQPAVAAYLGRMETALSAAGIAAPILVMLSEGALASVAVAARFPVRLIESGPAGGAMLAAAVARRIGRERLLSFDMGGTTAKICLIEGGRPQFETMFEADRIYRFRKGSGLPLRIPVVDLVEIGAGGGSIARTDAAGRLHVGPESAGAAPGPAAYGRGGTRPTVTDADLLLGRIVPGRFAGGAIGLDRELAARAAAAAVGAPLGLPPPADAAAIAELVEENMAGAARTHGAEKGRDLAAYTLLAFGGAAGLHAAPMAARLGIEEIVVPPNAGVGSAVGFLVAPAAFSIRRTVFAPLEALDQFATDALWREMAAEARAIVATAGAAQGPAAGADAVESWAVDLRYAGQGTDITIPLDRGAWQASG
ncbi:MAG: hydantoinase/oxoprolinase family protein, partial [Alphaproteobacteria bacterium]|nr:hydantoinase/oxoprolinase family protein [Alphaproteobacteria bacterium]